MMDKELIENCLLTLDEEYAARLRWKKLLRDISWRDYWLKTQLTKAIPIIAEELKRELEDEFSWIWQYHDNKTRWQAFWNKYLGEVKDE